MDFVTVSVEPKPFNLIKENLGVHLYQRRSGIVVSLVKDFSQSCGEFMETRELNI